MHAAQLIYHDEPDGWWADSPDLPGYSAAGATFEEVRRLVREGAPWFAELEELELHHLVPGSRAWWAAASIGARGRGELLLAGATPHFSIQPSGLLAA